MASDWVKEMALKRDFDSVDLLLVAWSGWVRALTKDFVKDLELWVIPLVQR
jgi:folate-dependent phosphoribosylglycinamide formyltransferase PurN